MGLQSRLSPFPSQGLYFPVHNSVYLISSVLCLLRTVRTHPLVHCQFETGNLTSLSIMSLSVKGGVFFLRVVGVARPALDGRGTHRR